MPSGGDLSPPPSPPPPEAAGSEEEEEEDDDDGEAEDSAQPTRTPTPQTQQRFDELCCRLNMDEAARAEAWDSYRSMSESYTLEVRHGGGRGEVFPGLVVTPAAGRGPSCPPTPGRAPRRDHRPPRQAPGWEPSLRAVDLETGLLKSSRWLRRRTPSCCSFLWGSEWGTPVALMQPPARPRSRLGGPGYKLTATWSAEGTGAGAGTARSRGGACPRGRRE